VFAGFYAKTSGQNQSKNELTPAKKNSSMSRNANTPSILRNRNSSTLYNQIAKNKNTSAEKRRKIPNRFE